jgi:hypothetical protein
MTLLDDVLQVSGLEQWRQLRRVTVHLSISGALFSRVRGSALMKDMVVEGRVHEQALEMTGFTAPDRRALYCPDRVALERSDGQLLKERRDTAAEFRRNLQASSWDDLLLAFYCGSLIRSYFDIPFVLADGDVVVSEGALSKGRDKRLRPLQVRFPERLAAHTADSTLYFDTQALLQRQEYAALHADGMRIAQTYSGHQRYSGVLVPTLCRLLLLMNEHDTAISARPPLVDIEIFDAAFE